MPTIWQEKNKTAEDGWSSVRYAGAVPTDFVLIGGVVIPAEGSAEEVVAVSWSERSVSATSHTERSVGVTSWTEKT